VTAPDLDYHGEQAARDLAADLAFIPPSILADPYAFGVRAIQRLIADHWRRVPPPPDWHTTGQGDPPTPEYLAAKAAITRKDDPDA
jgi:hypothetical protein